MLGPFHIYPLFFSFLDFFHPSTDKAVEGPARKSPFTHQKVKIPILLRKPTF